jgi:methionine sulfoxide reductase catalytic subunit
LSNYINKYSEKDITSEKIFLNRRQLFALAGGFGAAALIPGKSLADNLGTRKPNTFEDIINYNNFYEFGVGKSDPAKYAHALTTDPWQITVDGLVDNPGIYDFQELVDSMSIEKRIYRFRCVEGWSMVIPWNGFQLSDLLDKIGVKDQAKYVAFETLFRPEEMYMQKTKILKWPYKEGLRLDEAMHPLTLMATGVYDKPLPNQNGAPLRLVVPWKYGFKSIKSIVRISLVEEEPLSSWNIQNPREYGFYSNVNPNVHHPRWSQASERYIGKNIGGGLGGLFAERHDTMMYNGYNEVSNLYKDMDLSVFF